MNDSANPERRDNNRVRIDKLDFVKLKKFFVDPSKKERHGKHQQMKKNHDRAMPPVGGVSYGQ